MDEEMKTKEDPIPRTTSAIADSDSDGESPISSKKQRKDHGRIHEVDGEEDASTSQVINSTISLSIRNIMSY